MRYLLRAASAQKAWTQLWIRTHNDTERENSHGRDAKPESI